MDDVNQRPETEQSPRYQIKIQGQLDERWSEWFNGMAITIETEDEVNSITTLTGGLDQSALHAILSRIGNINLKLLSVCQIKPD